MRVGLIALNSPQTDAERPRRLDAQLWRGGRLHDVLGGNEVPQERGLALSFVQAGWTPAPSR
jgi:hypothetical protein